MERKDVLKKGLVSGALAFDRLASIQKMLNKKKMVKKKATKANWRS